MSEASEECLFCENDYGEPWMQALNKNAIKNLVSNKDLSWPFHHFKKLET